MSHYVFLVPAPPHTCAPGCPSALHYFCSVSIPLSQRLRARAAPRYVTHCGRSNVNKDEGVRPAAEDDDEHKQWQRQRMGIDDKDIHNRSRYVVSRVSPSPHACLVLIFPPAPPSTWVPSPPRPFTLPPSTSHTPPMLRTTSTINRALEPTRVRSSPQVHACILACVQHLRSSARPHALTAMSVTPSTAATKCPDIHSLPRPHICSSPRVHARLPLPAFSLVSSVVSTFSTVDIRVVPQARLCNPTCTRPFSLSPRPYTSRHPRLHTLEMIHIKHSTADKSRWMHGSRTRLRTSM